MQHCLKHSHTYLQSFLLVHPLVSFWHCTIVKLLIDISLHSWPVEQHDGFVHAADCDDFDDWSEVLHKPTQLMISSCHHRLKQQLTSLTQGCDAGGFKWAMNFISLSNELIRLTLWELFLLNVYFKPQTKDQMKFKECLCCVSKADWMADAIGNWS